MSDVILVLVYLQVQYHCGVTQFHMYTKPRLSVCGNNCGCLIYKQKLQKCASKAAGCDLNYVLEGVGCQAEVEMISYSD